MAASTNRKSDQQKADGSLYLTARDLALWDQALNSGKVITRRMQEAIFTPARLNDGSSTSYGYGWFVGKQNGHRLISHGGAWQGFRTSINRFVDDKLTVIVLANSTTARPGKFSDMVAAHYVPALAPVPAKPIKDNDPAVTARVREMVSRLAASELPPGFTEEMATTYTPALLKNLGQDLRAEGALRSVSLLEAKTDGEARQFRYRFSFERNAVLVSVRFNQSGQVERFGLGLE